MKSNAPARAIERVLAGTLALLRDPRDTGLARSERERHFPSWSRPCNSMAADSSRASSRRFARAWRENRIARRDGRRARSARRRRGLELMNESRVEIDIEISRAMQIIDSTAEWELRELQTFTSTLCGLQHVSADSNPLRPIVYATALWDATGAVSPVQASRAILLRLAAGVAAGLLKSAWAAASSPRSTRCGTRHLQDRVAGPWVGCQPRRTRRRRSALRGARWLR